MGFLAGPATFRRFQVVTLDNKPATVLGPNDGHLEAMKKASLAKNADSRGVGTGWVASHPLDGDFTWEKNTLENWLLFGLAGGQVKYPPELRLAYYETDLAALAKNNPSGLPSKRQKREARETANDRLEKEAADGRFTRRRAFELLWDTEHGELLLACAGHSPDRVLRRFFRESFELELSPVSAGTLAHSMARVSDDWQKALADLKPSVILDGLHTPDVAWMVDDQSRDFLGNEFLLWLWFQCDDESAEVKLLDNTTATVFFSKALDLECPRGQSGKESFRFEGPTRMPEALRGIQSGKLPRKAGLTIVRHDEQVAGTLQAEDMAWSGAKFPSPEETEAGAIRSARLRQVRDFIETSDLLFEAFLTVRLDPTLWKDQAKRINRWLTKERLVAA